MNNRTHIISTNLYHLISAMHDEHGSIDSRIPTGITIGLEVEGKNENLDGKVPEKLG